MHTTYEDTDNDSLLNVVKQQHPEVYQCVLKISDFIKNNYQYSLSGEEQLYLTIHIQRIVSKSE